MSKIIFLEQRLFRNNMVETYQLRELEAMGHQVEIWYLGKVFDMTSNVVFNAPALAPYMVIIESFQELKQRVKGLEKNSVFFSMLGLLYYYPFLYKIIKARKDLIWIGRITKSNLSVKRSNKKSFLQGVWGDITYFRLYKPINNLFYYISQKLIRKWGPRFNIKSFQTDYLMVSNLRQVPPSFPGERVILTHADDYNVHLLTKDTPIDPAREGAIVFLDQMIYFHPDFRKLTENPDVDGYYRNLNKTLDEISRKWGRPVVIAGHPESEKHPHYAERFKGKSFVVGQSVNLVRHASLVLIHYSTALNFAAIYNKPLMLLTSMGLESIERISEEIKLISQTLHAPVVNIDKDEVDSLKLNFTPDYAAYKADYIKSENTPEELSYPYAVNYALGRVGAKASALAAMPG